MDCTIRLTDAGTFALHFPSLRGHGHTVVVPPTEAGLVAIKRALAAHQRSPEASIGHEATPTQGMITEWLRHNSVTKPAQAGKAIDLDLDIDL